MAFDCLLAGNDNLTIQCGAMCLDAGHRIRAVLTHDPRVAAWADKAGLPVAATDEAMVALLAGDRADWFFSVANTDMLSDAVLASATKGAVNFHDGPLPRYAGLNAPVWAILNGETTHGITWHLIEGAVDEGRILVQRQVNVTDSDTALTLNARCFAAAIESFDEVLDALATGAPQVYEQDLSQRTYFGRHDRPAGSGVLDPSQPAADLARIVRALNHGDYRNPVATAKLMIGSRMILVREAEVTEGSGAPGQIVDSGEGWLTLATGAGRLRLSGLSDPLGAPLVLPVAPGTTVSAPDIDAAIAEVVRAEGRWMRRLADYRPALWCADTGTSGQWSETLDGLDADSAALAFALIVAARAGSTAVDLAHVAPAAPGLSPWRPLRADPEGALGTAAAAFRAALDDARTDPGFATDLPARCPDLSERRLPDAAISDAGAIPGPALTLTLDGTPTFHADLARISEAEARLFAARIRHLADALHATDDTTPVADLPILPDAERRLVLRDWNATATDYATGMSVHGFFEAQVRARPDVTALVFEGESLTYTELNTRANRLAHTLRDMGVTEGQPVGLHVRRSLDLVVSALGILKAGGAYLPLDPAYPADRIALYIEDSETRVIVGETALPLQTSAEMLTIDADPRLSTAPDTDPGVTVAPESLAYMIYTSGSTGRPKGVMVEHRNVSNFFTGMDARLPHQPGSVLMAVTSLSFDISVLELFWTLARGFKVVLSGEEKLVAGAVSDPRPVAGGMDFSLFYWGNDDGVGRDKYAMLLEGAKFADDHGFTAVWTPERHFHAFGGLYPNPSVTGAAVAAVTKNIGVRAGSCVAPLHHVARIAEEWAVIDNLTGGRAGLAIASGWQPDDFVLNPANTPPANKPAMFRAIEDLRKLWAGEAIEMTKADGTTVSRVTQPRPVSSKLPVWVTTAGNPETWKQAGQIGANVLTHLLGQTVDEVGQKIAIYHAALREAGHDPKDFAVTLMLHTYLAADRETAREIAREPMKNYLRSAADLIKQYAWAFPAFKRPPGADSAHQIDLSGLDAEEMEAILDFAFERYFERSGLFGTIDDAMARVAEVKAHGVTEVACLIDYGIERQTVLDALRPLAEVVRRANEGHAQDWSIAAQIERHGVTHFQCTPYMARMLVSNDDARAALSRVKHLMIGGEALAGTLVAELNRVTGATITNMYGPTETTIWSTTAPATSGETTVGIGTPIANTRCYVLDDAMRPCAVGVTGQLWIAGAGVTRGYWKRDDLTAEKFRADPFVEGERMFGTGDLARWTAQGKLDFLGRNDAQVKVRGFRIELGEIEAALEADASVRQAVVTAEPDASSVPQLTAYIMGEADTTALRTRLTTELPAHMVPARMFTLDAFPLTPNRKVDRKALPAAVKARAEGKPAPKAVQPAAANAPTAPAEGVRLDRRALLETVGGVWSEILGVGTIQPGDNFFDLGGHSLLAVEAHRALRAKLGLKALSIADIFRAPTLSGLVQRIETLSGGGDGPKPSQPSPEAESASAASMADARRALRQRRGS